MNFSSVIRKKNILLVPFSWLYKAGVFFYHKLYDLNILKSYHPSVKTICIGNLSVGGTGKSPMVEYLLRLLSGIVPLSQQHKLQVAVVSRGYRRKTTGFVLAGAHTTADDIGDEPMQFHKKFPDVIIAADEKRAEGIDMLLKQNSGINVIVLDDAFQHRAVTAGLNILLTEYKNIFTEDWYLPAGSLRDLKFNYKRAGIIVVTKCNTGISDVERKQIINKIKPLPYQKIFFTALDYGKVYNIFNNHTLELNEVEAIVLVTGIANPQPMLTYLDQYNVAVKHVSFGDHHHFSDSDIGDILGTYQSVDIENKIILTTEKDAMRLIKWKPLQNMPVFALPVQHRFLFGEGDEFNSLIVEFAKPGLTVPV